MKRFCLFVFFLCMIVSFACFSCAETPSSKGYGFIDRDGHIVIEPQFQYAYSFKSDRARIFSGTMSSWGYYPGEGHYGYIDSTGKEVIPIIYEEAEDFNENGKAAVSKNGKYGIIDVDGNPVVDFSYDYITYNNSVHMFRAFKGTMSSYGFPESGTYYILDDDCVEKCSITSDRLYLYEGYIEVHKNDKCALFSYEGEQLTDYRYKSVGAYSESLLYFKEYGSSKFGYMDINGNVIIEPSYDNAYKFENGKALVEKDKKYYLIDTKGQIVTTYDFDYIGSSPSSGYTYAFVGSLNEYGSPGEGKYYLIDIEGNTISRGYKKGDCYSITNGYWRVKENNTWYVLDMSGKEVFSVSDCEYLYTCGADRYVAKRNGYFALLDALGNPITGYIWDEMNNNSEGLIPVYSAGNEPDFRSVRWGMSEEEVKAIEGSNPPHTGKLNGSSARYIGYDTTLMGNDVILAYYFSNEGLFMARYIWAESHSNESLYISDYENVRTQLTKKYGAPWHDEETWDTTSHKKYYSDDKGRALSFGYLSYDTWYRNSRTSISMHMSADNYDVSFIIYYESNSISAPAEDYSDQF